MTVVDTGSSNIDGAKIIIVTNFAAGQDILGFSPNPQNGISGSYDASRGELDLVGTATPALYQAALPLNHLLQQQHQPVDLDPHRGVRGRGRPVERRSQLPLNYHHGGQRRSHPQPDHQPSAIFENSGQQTIDLGGITAGAARSRP